MVNTKIMFLGMVFGGVLGFGYSFTQTDELLSPWNFVAAFITAVIGFVIVYYFYKYFY